MVEITIQVPDRLAQRLESLHDRLPELLWQLVENPNEHRLLEPESSEEVLDDFSARYMVYREVLDFLSDRPTPEEIVGFKVSDRTQNRLSELLEKNRESTLDSMEMAELDIFEQLDHLTILLTASAYSKIESALDALKQ